MNTSDRHSRDTSPAQAGVQLRRLGKARVFLSSCLGQPGSRPSPVRHASPKGRTGVGLLCLALTACGSAAGLKPATGEALPIAPRGARVTPTPGDLLTPTTQQRPQRGDELLKRSEARRSDDFDLPPAD